MSVGSLFFSVCALVALVGAVSTVAAKNPIRGAVGLLATIVAIAALFLKLAAQFLAAIQLIVYAGAVVVLFVFVIMLLGPDANTGGKPAKVSLWRWGGASLLVLLAGAALFVTRNGFGPPVLLGPVRADYGSTEAVGGLLFRHGLVPFEIATALLIVAVVGAIAVARSKPKAKKTSAEEHETRRMFAGPLHPRDAERPLPKESGR
jgi:NADH-quinone oxidoreductase subunit J